MSDKCVCRTAPSTPGLLITSQKLIYAPYISTILDEWMDGLRDEWMDGWMDGFVNIAANTSSIAAIKYTTTAGFTFAATPVTKDFATAPADLLLGK